MIDGATLKRDFPILSQTVDDRPLVYLDSAASSQKPKAVLEALERFYTTDNANVHRGVHRLAERATEAYEGARVKTARFLNADPKELIWTRNATEAINLVAHAYGRPRLSPDDEILVTIMEHHSNLVPWHLLAQRTGAVIRSVPITPEFTLDLDRFRELLSERTKIVAVSHMSNVLGTINPVRQLADLAHSYGAVVVADGGE